MAKQEELELHNLLMERLELVNSDPDYEGEQASASDQWWLALVGLIIPAVMLILGWVLHG